MGRPVNKRYFGKLPDADDPTLAPTSGDTFFNLEANVQIGSAAESTIGYILAQKGPSKFLVANGATLNDESMATSTKYVINLVGDTNWESVGVYGAAYVGRVFTTPSSLAGATFGTGTVRLAGTCKLVDAPDGSLSANEMSIMGQIASSGSQIRIKKLYNRIALDFSGNRYKWTIQDDSSVTALILTAI
jgi:hypothetical protein